MIPFELAPENQGAQSDVRRLMDGAMNNIIQLDTAPTAANNTLPEGVIGFNLGKVYFKINTVLYDLTLNVTA